MTLIAKFTVNQVPIMVADVLVSAPPEAAQTVSLPLHPEINQLLDGRAEHSVVRATQKLNVLSDQLIVAWSGNYDNARFVLKEIEAVAEQVDLSWQTIGGILAALPSERTKDIQLIGMIASNSSEDKIRIDDFYWNVALRNCGPFERVMAGGSGASSFISLLERSTDSLSIFKGGQIPPGAFGLQLVGQMFGYEATSGQNLLQRWGGGFELATFAQRRFRKVGGILHAFWKAVKLQGSELVLELIPMFLKSDYWNDVLVLRVMELELLNGSAGSVKRDEVHLVLPLLKSKENYDMRTFQVPDFSHTTLCCYVSPGAITPNPGEYVRTEHKVGGVDLFRIHPNVEGYKLGISHTLLEKLITGYLARINALS